MAIVRYVLAKLKPGVSPEEYERFEREVDYVVAGRLKTIVSYRTHRITATDARLAGGPWDYIERIEITDRAAYDTELAAAGVGFQEYGTRPVQKHGTPGAVPGRDVLG